MKIIPINQPTLPSYDTVARHMKQIFVSRMITNAEFVQRLERDVKKRLGVGEAVALSSNTSGLILTLQALSGGKGEVLIPSFTFCATAHAVVWNGLKPVFVECDPYTFNIDFTDLEKKISKNTSAILGVHVFGNPIDMLRLRRIASSAGLPLIIDGAHALGSKYNGKSVACFADATVFSLAPTKLTTSAEGGIVATNNIALARRLRLARNYGNPPDYNCRIIGLNARLSELHAALGIESFKLLNAQIAKRNALVDIYRHRLTQVKGIRFQEVDKKDLSTYNYFAIVLDKDEAKVSVTKLKDKLSGHGIQTKRYFFPPVHRQKAYRDLVGKVTLKITDELSNTTLCLPLFSHLDPKTVHFICDKVNDIAG